MLLLRVAEGRPSRRNVSVAKKAGSHSAIEGEVFRRMQKMLIVFRSEARQ